MNEAVRCDQDIHGSIGIGYGPTLLAGAEMLRLIENKWFKINGSASNPVMYSEKEKE